MIKDPDPERPKPNESSGSGSATLVKTESGKCKYINLKRVIITRQNKFWNSSI